MTKTFRWIHGLLMSSLKSAILMCGAIFVVGNASAHYPYIAPLSYQTFNNQTAVVAGFYDNPFVSEIAIKNFQFHLHTPMGEKIDLNDADWAKTQTMSSYSLQNKVNGTYRLRGEKMGSLSRFALDQNAWKPLLGMEPAKNKPTNKNVVYTSQLAKNAKVKTVQTQEIIETFVSRREVSNQVVEHLHDGFDVQFLTHPNAIKVNQPIRLKLWDNKKGIAQLKIEILAQTTDFGREAKLYTSSATNAQGELDFSIPETGQYLLKVDYQQPFENKGNELKRYKYTLSFNVIAH